MENLSWGPGGELDGVNGDIQFHHLEMIGRRGTSRCGLPVLSSACQGIQVKALVQKNFFLLGYIFGHYLLEKGISAGTYFRV